MTEKHTCSNINCSPYLIINTFGIKKTHISSGSLYAFIHNKGETVIRTDLIFRLESIFSSFGILHSEVFVIDVSEVLSISVHLLDDSKNSSHSASVEAILDFEEILQHLDQEGSLVFIGTDKLRTGVTFNEPEVELIIKHEVQTEHLIDVALFPESVSGHSSGVDEGLLESRSKVIFNPVGISGLGNVEKIAFELLESPHLIVQELLRTHTADVNTGCFSFSDEILRELGVGEMDALVSRLLVIALEGNSKETIMIVHNQRVGGGN